MRGDTGDGTAWLVIVDPDTGRARVFHAGVTAAGIPPAGGAGRVWTEQTITDDLPNTGKAGV